MSKERTPKELKISKLLILDGISGVPLGKEICEAFIQNGIATTYTDLRAFSSKRFYNLEAVYKKLMNKKENADSFYHFPKLDEKQFEAFRGGSVSLNNFY